MYASFKGSKNDPISTHPTSLFRAFSTRRNIPRGTEFFIVFFQLVLSESPQKRTLPPDKKQSLRKKSKQMLYKPR